MLRQVNQEGVHTRMLLEELVLLYEITRQEAGVVTYRATLRGQPLVAKLPIQLTTTCHHRDPGSLDEVMRRYDAVSIEAFAEARDGLMRECRRAERVLDPPSERIIRDYHNNRREDGLSAVERDVIAKGRQRWQDDWPGYAHMHPIVHLDANIPLLLSASAQGTICDLRFLLREEEPSPSREWLDVAWQLSEAITFLRQGAKLAHADIKPDNVFYTTQSDGRPHIWLGDYGLVRPVRRRRVRPFGGVYMPVQTPTTGATYDHQQLFAYYATLLDLICFPSAQVDVDWLSRTGGNVSAGLLEAMRTQSPLVTRATPDMYAHIMCPLLDTLPLSQRFERTREWLLRMGQ